VKRIFGIVLLSLVALTACGNDDAAAVCTTLEMGGTTLTIYTEGEYITEYFLESSLYVGDWSEEEIENTQRFNESAGIDDELDGDYLIMVQLEDLREENVLLDDFIEQIEAGGGSCD